MQFSWDENKRLRTLADRGLDFVDAYRFFDGRPALHLASPRHDEERLKSVIAVDGVHYTPVWMWRGETRHVNSMRRAHAKETGAYRQLYG